MDLAAIPTETARDWDHAKTLLGNATLGWVFRGQRRSDWGLVTSLERSAVSLRAHLKSGWKLEASEIIEGLESLLLLDFERDMKQFCRTELQPSTKFEWLALFQHHGGPTRLLDWTRSPYVAAYFALEDVITQSAGPDGHCSVWAVDPDWFKHAALRELRLMAKAEFEDFVPLYDQAYHDAIFTLRPPGILPVDLYVRNDRMSAQSGVFLIPGDPSRTFMENLLANSTEDINQHILKIDIPGACAARALADLSKMGIRRRSLFPGLDGIAKDIKLFYEYIGDPQVNKRLVEGPPSG